MVAVIALVLSVGAQKLHRGMLHSAAAWR